MQILRIAFIGTMISASAPAAAGPEEASPPGPPVTKPGVPHAAAPAMAGKFAAFAHRKASAAPFSPGQLQGSVAEPAEAAANNALAVVARREEAWNAAWGRLDQALKLQDKNYDLLAEAETAEAFLGAVRPLRDANLEIHKTYRELFRINSQLANDLGKLPLYCEEAAKLYDGWAGESSIPSIRENYKALAQVWRARATVFRKRKAEVATEYDPATDRFLEEWGLLLARMVTSLENYPPIKLNSEMRHQVLEQLKQHVRQLDQLSDGIRRWRDAALKQAESAKVGKELGASIERRDTLGPLVASLQGQGLQMQGDAAGLARNAARSAAGNGTPPLVGQEIPMIRVDLRRGTIAPMGLALLTASEGRWTLALPADYTPDPASDYLLPPWIEVPAAHHTEEVGRALEGARRSYATAAGSREAKLRKRLVELEAQHRRRAEGILAGDTFALAKTTLGHLEWLKDVYGLNKFTPIPYYDIERLRAGDLRPTGQVRVNVDHSGTIYLREASYPGCWVKNCPEGLVLVPTSVRQRLEQEDRSYTELTASIRRELDQLRPAVLLASRRP
jgi:hypothetical protein